ncbi:hypothetical protein Q1695_014867 [Nippostrongylus brasiliensis]|nr:hypothetical protein Q1695_014867 [Nippostrongylus brasiliensis]
MHAPGGLLREDFEAGEEELPIVGEVEVVTHHDENAEYFVENPVEPSIVDTNNELLNGLETISKVLDHASIQKLKDFDSYLRDLIPDATAATNELFRLTPSALKNLRDSVPDTLEKELLREYGIPLENVVDFEERCAEVQQQFDDLIAIPARMENPRIYHLDVGAMYPNMLIIIPCLGQLCCVP